MLVTSPTASGSWTTTRSPSSPTSGMTTSAAWWRRRWRRSGLLLHQIVPGHHLLQGVRGQGVDPRQILYDHVGARRSGRGRWPRPTRRGPSPICSPEAWSSSHPSRFSPFVLRAVEGPALPSVLLALANSWSKNVSEAQAHKAGAIPHMFTGSVEHALAHIEESIQDRVDVQHLRWYRSKTSPPQRWAGPARGGSPPHRSGRRRWRRAWVEHALAHIEESIQDRVDVQHLRWYSIKVFERDERVLEELGIGGGVRSHPGGDNADRARVGVIEVGLRLPRLIGGDDCLRLLKGPVSLLPAVRVGGEGDEPALPEQAVVGPVGEPRPHGHGPWPHGDGVDQKTTW